MRGTRRDGERGATAIVIALLAVALLGMGAYVIDVGALFQERRELQVGADAAALAVARDCALGDCGDTYATAATYADANASDGAADVPAGNITFPAPDRVRVETVTADGGDNTDGDSGTIDYLFARIFGKTGRGVTAAATVQWGPPKRASTVPLVFSLCEFTAALGEPAAGDDPYPADRFPVERVIYFHTGNNEPSDCAAQAGQDTDGDGKLDGGFGWLQSTGCYADLDLVDGYYWAQAKTGNGPPNDCDPDDILGRQLLLPIFDDVVDGNDPGWAEQCTGGGMKKCYRIFGFAAYEVTGFRFPGNGWTSNPAPCNPPKTCLGGRFIKFVPASPDGEIGGPDLGAYIVRLVE